MFLVVFLRIGFWIWIILCQALLAKDPIHLFGPDGKQRLDYSNQLEQLMPGDKIEFNDGMVYEFISKLGNGNTTYVVKVKPINNSSLPDIIALRIPLKKGRFSLLYSYVDFIDLMGESYKTLNSSLVAPRLFRYEKGQYLAVELMSTSGDLMEFLSELDTLDSSIKLEKKRALIEFAKLMAPYSDIGDLRPDQILYDPTQQRWFLVDWTSVKRYGVLKWRNPFSDLKEKIIDKGKVWRKGHQEAFQVINELIRVVDKYRQNNCMTVLDRIFGPIK